MLQQILARQLDAWKSGRQLLVEQLVDGDTSEQLSSEAWLELIKGEISLRAEYGQPVIAADFLDRFPHFATRIQRLFQPHGAFESAEGDTASEDVTRIFSLDSVGPDSPATFSRPHPVEPRSELDQETIEIQARTAQQLGEYRLVREIGRGGMGTVFEAVHIRQGHRVAIKTLPKVDGPRLHRFKREFRAAAEINHPNLIGLHQLEADDGHWFLTMDLISGVDFLSYVRPNGRLDPSRLRTALPQLVAGMLALHSNQIVHRDLKPANVMVEDSGRVVVLDFGLVAQLDMHANAHSFSKITGTPIYMAPEQAASQPACETADLYALGVILYEAISGEPPIQGSMLQVLQRKQTEEAPVLFGAPDELADWADLAMGLLAIAPEDRPTGEEVARRTKVEAPVASITADTPDEIVGRDEQLANLREMFELLQTRREAVTAFISGRSGEGKTALIDFFLRPIRKENRVTILSGRCYDRESVPFKALDSLIDALANHLKLAKPEELALLIPRDIAILADVFPVLQRVKVIANAPKARIAGLDGQQLRNRAFTALSELLLRMSDSMPLLLFIDDLQWGDADSAEVMFEIFRPPETPTIFFLGSFRSDEATESPFLQRWGELQRQHGIQLNHRDVRVGPLTLEQCTSLIVKVVGRDTAVVRGHARQLYEESGGNPFFLIDLLNCFDAATGVLHPLPIHEVIANKLESLPQGAEQILHAAAVSGQAILAKEVLRAAGLGSSALSTLIHMRKERLLRLLGNEQELRVDTYHDKVRECVSDNLPDDVRTNMHRRLALAIEESAGSVPDTRLTDLETREGPGDSAAIARVFDLAYHFDAANERRRALLYSLLAAEQAKRQFAPEVTATQYGIAKRNSAGSSQAIRYRIAAGAGKALMLMGRYDSATKELEGSIELTSDDVDKAEIEALQGEIAFKQGAMQESVRHYESGLRRLGNRIPRTKLGLVYRLWSETFVQFLNTLFSRRLYREQSNRKEDLVIRLFTRLVTTTAFRTTPRMLWASLAGMNRAERYPPSLALAYNYAIHAAVMSSIGWHRRATKYEQLALDWREEFNDVWGLGHSHGWKGIGLHARARYAEGAEALRTAIAQFEKAGDIWELHLARFHLACCLYGLGDVQEAMKETLATFEGSVKIGDPRTLCSLYLWSKVSRGQMPFDELEKSCPRIPEDVLSTCNLAKGEGFWHLFHRRPTDAVAAFRQAWGEPANRLLLNYHAVAALPELVSALRLDAEAHKDSDPDYSRKQLRCAFKLAKRGAWITIFYPSERPQMLRELSLVLVSRGQVKKSLSLIRKSCVLAKRQDAKYELARSNLVHAKISKQLGLADADGRLELAEAELARFLDAIAAANINGANMGVEG